MADHCELFVEGRAFEDDAKVLRDAVREGWNVTATLLVGGGESEKVEGLKLLYLSDQIDPESRAFHFYLRLPNEVVLDKKSDTGHRFIEWHFKPGQRMELRCRSSAGRIESCCRLTPWSRKGPRRTSTARTVTILTACRCTSSIAIATRSLLPTTGPCFPATLWPARALIRCTWP